MARLFREIDHDFCNVTFTINNDKTYGTYVEESVDPIQEILDIETDGKKLYEQITKKLGYNLFIVALPKDHPILQGSWVRCVDCRTT